MVYGVKIKAGNTPQLFLPYMGPQYISFTLARFHKNFSLFLLLVDGRKKIIPILILLER